jgi:hypothetical protein
MRHLPVGGALLPLRHLDAEIHACSKMGSPSACVLNVSNTARSSELMHTRSLALRRTGPTLKCIVTEQMSHVPDATARATDARAAAKRKTTRSAGSPFARRTKP